MMRVITILVLALGANAPTPVDVGRLSAVEFANDAPALVRLRFDRAAPMTVAESYASMRARITDALHEQAGDLWCDWFIDVETQGVGPLSVARAAVVGYERRPNDVGTMLTIRQYGGNLTYTLATSFDVVDGMIANRAGCRPGGVIPTALWELIRNGFLARITDRDGPFSPARVSTVAPRQNMHVPPVEVRRNNGDQTILTRRSAASYLIDLLDEHKRVAPDIPFYADWLLAGEWPDCHWPRVHVVRWDRIHFREQMAGHVLTTLRYVPEPGTIVEEVLPLCFDSIGKMNEQRVDGWFRFDFGVTGSSATVRVRPEARAMPPELVTIPDLAPSLWGTRPVSRRLLVRPVIPPDIPVPR